MTNQSFFITGTDTNVGKTTITAALILALQQQGNSVGVLKPVETGVDIENREHSDTDRLRRLLSPPLSFDSVCLYAFPQPLSPLAAAHQTGNLQQRDQVSYSVLGGKRCKNASRSFDQ